jgi:hypothetical protein
MTLVAPGSRSVRVGIAKFNFCVFKSRRDANRGSLKMSNLDQTKFIESIRELTLDELQAVSGGGDGDDLGGDFDGGGPVPTCTPGMPGC